MTGRDSELTVRKTSQGVVFWVHVTPRARAASVGGCHGNALRVAVRPPPIEGKANGACARALARALGVRAGDVDLDPAARNRRKRVVVNGDAARLTLRLRELAEGPPVG